MKSILLLLLITYTFAQVDYFSLQPITYPQINGWYNEAPIIYYSFFSNSTYIASSQTISTISLYSLVTGFDASNNPIPVVGQHNIADTIFGQNGYSDLWSIQFVTVPSSYVANTIMDVITLLKPSYNYTVTQGPMVNCPMVPIGSSLQGGEKTITLGWYQNKSINYIDFGPNNAYTIPIYVVGNSPAQHNIVTQIPGQSGYSAFWNAMVVTAPSGYVANTYKSVADIGAAKLGTPAAGPTGINCPVVFVGNATVNSNSGGTTTTSSSSSSNGSSVLIVSLFSVVLYLFL